MNQKENLPKFALITGASSGIGEATALRLSARGYGLILCARRLDRLQALAEKCKRAGANQTFARQLDVTSLSSVEAMFADDALQDAFKGLTIVINNAGLAKGFDKLGEAKISDWQTMIDTNVMGLLYVTRLALPLIKANAGHVVNIGSVSGVWTYPGGGVYCASKAAVRTITEGLRMDLMGSGVRVTNIEPGMVHTEFSSTRLGGDEARAASFYDGFQPLTADDIAQCIDWSLSRPAHVNIQEMIVFPTAQAGVSLLHRNQPAAKQS